jgi:hypothetical protein
MKFTKSLHIYAQFTNLMFESLFIIKKFLIQEIIIEDHENATFVSFVNDYSKTEKTFETLFKFLHERYFFKTTFEFIYLSLKNIVIFIEELNMIDLQINLKNSHYLLYIASRSWNNSYSLIKLSWIIFYDSFHFWNNLY